MPSRDVHPKLRREQTAFRLTREARQMLARLAKFDGITRTAVVELLIRRAARERSTREREATT